MKRQPLNARPGAYVPPVRDKRPTRIPTNRKRMLELWHPPKEYDPQTGVKK